MIAGEPDPPNPDVRTMIDAVRLRHGDERLDDLVRVTGSRLSATDLAAWHAWRQDWALRLLHRVQLAAASGAGVLAVVAAAVALIGDPVTAPAAELARSAAVVLVGGALFVELSMSTRSTSQGRFLTFPARVRLAARIRTRVNLQPLRDSAVEELIGGPRADAARLVVVARTCASSITGSARWCSGRLDLLRVRCDVDRVLGRIARDAAALERERVGGGTGPAAAPGWQSLVDRVGWLQRYEHQLRMLTTDPGGPLPADRRPATRRDRIVADLHFSVVVLTWGG
jgi:hypothetical protein